MPPIKDWIYKDAADAVAAAIKASVGEVGFKANSDFVEEKNHWQHGVNWPGSVGSGADPVRAQILLKVEPQFTPVDVIGEVLDNIANALLNKEADVSFTPLVPPDDPESDAAKRLATEADAMRAMVSTWWDRRKLWEKARKATKRSRWSGRGALRTWISPATLQPPATAGGPASIPTNLKFEDALDKVLLSAPAPNACFIATDAETNERAAVYLFMRGDKKFAEIWFVDGEDTVVRVIGDSDANSTSFPLKLGRRLPIAEMEADVLITEPVRRQQNRLNFFETILVRVGETAGFPERYTLNAKPQGTWLRTAPQNGPALETFEDDNGATWYLHSTPRTLGAAITTDLRGLTTKTAAGDEQLTTPSITIKEPTDPQYAITAADHARKTILHNCKQGHLAPDSTAEASGIAYVQARAIFQNDLTNTKGPLEGMLRDTIECAIATAELMSGVSPASSFLKRFRCVVNLHVNAGPITPEEKDSNARMVTAQLLSRESAMAANGIEDVSAEIAAIDSTPAAKRANAKSTGDTIKALKDAGAETKQAALLAGLTEQEATDFAASPFVTPPVAP